MTATVADDPVDGRAQVLTWYDSYASCLENKSVAAGAFNKLPPERAVDVAQSRCVAERNRFVSSFYRGAPVSEEHTRQLMGFVSIAEGRAQTAVIAARSGGRQILRPAIQ